MSKVGRSRAGELKEEGWVQQFLACEPRLSEAIELYESIGFEVHLQPVIPGEIDAECKVCYEIEPDRYKTIYTRSKKVKVLED